MAKFLISYDLIKRKDYPELYKAIKAINTGWWHCLESVWIVESTSSAIQIVEYLKGHVDSDDKIFVVQLDSDWATLHMLGECSDWLRSNL